MPGAVDFWGLAGKPPRGFRSGWFDTGEIRLHVVRGPAHGPPLVLLPGLNDPWFSYRDVVGPLSRHFHVHIVDWRGHGPSGRPSDGRYRVVDYASDIEMFLLKGVGAPAFVAGNSLGALVAAGLAARHPSRVLGCVLEDGPFFITTPARWRSSPLRPGLFGDVARRLERAERKDTTDAAFIRAWRSRVWRAAPRGAFPARAIYLGKFLALMAPRWASLSAGERRRLEQGCTRLLAGRVVRWADVQPEAVIDEAARTILRVASGCVRAATRTDFSAGFDHATALRAMRCPTLVLEADRDLVGLLPPADIARLVTCLRGTRARHIHCEGALHAIHRSHPSRYVEAVTSFLLRGP